MNIMIKYQPVMTLALNATTVAVVWFSGNMIIRWEDAGWATLRHLLII